MHSIKLVFETVFINPRARKIETRSMTAESVNDCSSRRAWRVWEILSMKWRKDLITIGFFKGDQYLAVQSYLFWHLATSTAGLSFTASWRSQPMLRFGVHHRSYSSFIEYKWLFSKTIFLISETYKDASDIQTIQRDSPLHKNPSLMCRSYDYTVR